MKEKIIFIIIAFLMGGFMGICFFQIETYINEPQNKVILITSLDPLIQIERQDIIKIQEIALQVSNEEEYKFGVYDCTEFSKELVKRLTEKNYSAECVFGQYLESEFRRPLHNWVIVTLDGEEISIEATNGKIYKTKEEIDYYFKYYREVRRGICI